MTRWDGQVFCSDMFGPSMSRVFLNFATLSNRVNPCSGVNMLSMSKQPQVATKTCHVTCPFREVKRKKRRRCWKIATLRLSRSWTGVICHSGSMPWGATPFSDLLLRWKSASIKKWLEANKGRMCMLFIVWIVVNETTHNKKTLIDKNIWHEKNRKSRMARVDTFAFSRCYCQYQNSLEIPGSEVPENCLASFVADSPRVWLRLSILFFVCWDRFTGNQSRALRRKWQEGMQLGFWGGCIMVYRQISAKL